MAKPDPQQYLARLLETIERDLTDWIPLAVEDLKIPSRAYGLFLWYQDYDDDWLPHFGVATELLLEDIAKMRFEDPLEKYDILWCPQQSEASDAPGRLFLDECELVADAVEECYELLALEQGLGSKMATMNDEELCTEEFAALKPFREMMHRVGRNLQAHQWTKGLKPMDDFAIVVSDYMGYFLEEDLQLSLGPALTERLISRDMLPSSPF